MTVPRESARSSWYAAQMSDMFSAGSFARTSHPREKKKSSRTKRQWYHGGIHTRRAAVTERASGFVPCPSRRQLAWYMAWHRVKHPDKPSEFLLMLSVGLFGPHVVSSKHNRQPTFAKQYHGSITAHGAQRNWRLGCSTPEGSAYRRDLTSSSWRRPSSVADKSIRGNILAVDRTTHTNPSLSGNVRIVLVKMVIPNGPYNAGQSVKSKLLNHSLRKSKDHLIVWGLNMRTGGNSSLEN